MFSIPLAKRNTGKQMILGLIYAISHFDLCRRSGCSTGFLDPQGNEGAIHAHRRRIPTGLLYHFPELFRGN